MKTVLAALASTIVLSACAGGYTPRYYINEVQVYNNSREPVRDVTIRAGERIFGCGNIAPLGICGDRFGRRDYQAGTIEVEWTLGNGAPRRQSLEARVPAYFTKGIPLRGILEIDPQGEVSTRFDQDPQFD